MFKLNLINLSFTQSLHWKRYMHAELAYHRQLAPKQIFKTLQKHLPEAFTSQSGSHKVIPTSCTTGLKV